MKRSEMIQVIQNADDEINYWQAEKILKAIEKAGMVPSAIYEVGTPFYAHKWEEEDPEREG